MNHNINYIIRFLAERWNDPESALEEISRRNSLNIAVLELPTLQVHVYSPDVENALYLIEGDKWRAVISSMLLKYINIRSNKINGYLKFF